MTEAEVKDLFVKYGAILEGHFLLTSGLHSGMYVEKFQVLQYPKATEQLCAGFAHGAHRAVDLDCRAAFAKANRRLHPRGERAELKLNGIEGQ